MDRRRFVLVAAAAVAPAASWAQALGPNPAGPSPAGLLGASGDPNFLAWLNDFYARSRARGFSVAVLDQALSGIAPDPRVAAKDAGQPEFAQPVSSYIRTQVTAARIAAGRSALAAMPQLIGVKARYGVPTEILVGIWAMESDFGRLQGDYDVIRSLATLAAAGRRRAWAESELWAAMQALEEGKVSRARLVGSWAGAMGQTQLLPSAFLADAVSASGTGAPDIWRSAPDALASAARLLAKAGWARGESWGRRVTAPYGFDFATVEGPAKPWPWWRQRGLRLADGLEWRSGDEDGGAVLIAPSGATGPLFLVLPNHFVIRAYNDSLAYALAVGLLADGFVGGQPLAIRWPFETPLSLTERMDAQSALLRLGFDPGPIDGLFGVRARAALRAWQKSRGLVADGYLTPRLVELLRAA
ncbi:MAG TPA: lytic murein transglycosylase [Caulobacteraceae bacterium]|nr:lytic murein transglycosylase [Caulobacteraceae bacterium]